MNLRVLGKNTSIYAIGNMMLRGVSFLLIPLYTHHLSLSDYGLLASLLVTIEFLLLFMSLGMRNTMERFCFEYSERNAEGMLVATTLVINLLWAALILAFCGGFLQPLFQQILHIEEVLFLIILTGSAATIQSVFLHMTAYYRARNNAMPFVIANIVAAVLIISSNLVFLKIFNLGISGALLAQIFSYGIVFLAVSIQIFFKIGFRLSTGILKELLSFGFPLIFSMSGQRLIGLGSMYILSMYAGLEIVGIYALGSKLAALLSIVLILPFQMAFQPFIYANLQKPDVRETTSRIFTYFCFALALISLGTLVGAKLVLPYIAPAEYGAAYLVILCLLPSIGLYGIVQFGEALLNIVRKTYISAILLGGAGLLSIPLNFMLIPRFEWLGAVATLNLIYLLSAGIIMWIGLRLYPVAIEWRRVAIALSMLTVFLSGIYLIQESHIIIFFLGSIFMALVSIGYLYFSNILTASEHESIKRALGRFV